MEFWNIILTQNPLSVGVWGGVYWQLKIHNRGILTNKNEKGITIQYCRLCV